jgi:hypothetical protein
MKTVRVALIGLFLGAALSVQSSIQKPPTGQPSVIKRPQFDALFPKITGADPDCVGTGGCGLIDVYGQNFGAAQGARRIIHNGVPVAKYHYWANNVVTITPTARMSFWPVHHTFSIDDGAGKKLSNVFDIVFLYKFDGSIPSQGPPGTEIKVWSWGAGPQAGKSLWLGTTPMTINFWPGGGYEYFTPIRAVVPSLAPGTYPITMRSGAQQVSKSSINFKVN